MPHQDLSVWCPSQLFRRKTTDCFQRAMAGMPSRSTGGITPKRAALTAVLPLRELGARSESEIKAKRPLRYLQPHSPSPCMVL